MNIMRLWDYRSTAYLNGLLYLFVKQIEISRVYGWILIIKIQSLEIDSDRQIESNWISVYCGVPWAEWGNFRV